jgi:hypothetical protein
VHKEPGEMRMTDVTKLIESDHREVLGTEFEAAKRG